MCLLSLHMVQRLAQRDDLLPAGFGKGTSTECKGM